MTAETRIVMRIGKLLFLTFVALPLLFAQAPPGGDEYWPKEIDTDNLHLVLSQPQVDSWKGNRIEARSAVIVTFKGDTTQIFGTVSISARTEIDKEARLVSPEFVRRGSPRRPKWMGHPAFFRSIRGLIFFFGRTGDEPDGCQAHRQARRRLTGVGRPS